MLADSYLIKFVLRQLQVQQDGDAQHLLMVFLGLLALVTLLQWLVRNYRELRKLPPGPWGLPVIGYLLFMGSEKHTRFMELAKQYGSLFSTRLGSQLTVVMSDYKMIRECFRREEFTGRPDTPFMQTLNGYGELPVISYQLSVTSAAVQEEEAGGDWSSRYVDKPPVYVKLVFTTLYLLRTCSIYCTYA